MEISTFKTGAQRQSHLSGWGTDYTLSWKGRVDTAQSWPMTEQSWQLLSQIIVIIRSGSNTTPDGCVWTLLHRCLCKQVILLISSGTLFFTLWFVRTGNVILPILPSDSVYCSQPPHSSECPDGPVTTGKPSSFWSLEQLSKPVATSPPFYF